MSEQPDFEARKKAVMARLTARQPATKTMVASAPVIVEAEELLKKAEEALGGAALPPTDLLSNVENVLVTLPPSRLSRRLKETLNQLRQRLTKESQAAKPSFSFSRKPQASTKVIPVVQKSEEEEVSRVSAPPPNSVCVSKKENAREVYTAEDGTDASISDVENSYFVFGFRPSTVHIIGVRNSTLVFLPVKTSILIRNCSGLTLAAAAQQIRIHDSTDLNLHVSIRGAVIIERCSQVRVAPYRMSSGLIDSTELPEDDKWDAIQDFNWLVTSRPSPNWSKMEEDAWKEFDLQLPQ